MSKEVFIRTGDLIYDLAERLSKENPECRGMTIKPPGYDERKKQKKNISIMLKGLRVLKKSRLLRIVSWVCPSCNEYHVIGGCLGCIHFNGGYLYLKGSKCQKCNALHIFWEGP